jgi:hypothetical protein
VSSVKSVAAFPWLRLAALCPLRVCARLPTVNRGGARVCERRRAKRAAGPIILRRRHPPARQRQDRFSTPFFDHSSAILHYQTR